jgi:hypothetical protein
LTGSINVGSINIPRRAIAKATHRATIREHRAKKWPPIFATNDAFSRTWRMMPDAA